MDTSVSGKDEIWFLRVCRAPCRKHSLTSFHVCYRRLERVATRNFYLDVILSLFLTVFYIILVDSMLSPSCYNVLRPITMTENIIIKELLSNPFSMHPLHDKLRIMNKGRPTARLPYVITHHKTKTERCTIHICICQCEQFDWLTGCETAKIIYFWPISLFFITNAKGF